MKVSDFDYQLPPELIAQHPADKRDESRLLVYHREDGAIEHRLFRDIKEYFKKGDCIVINETKVIPARLYGSRAKDGKRIEFLLLEGKGRDTWEVLVKPGKRARIGNEFIFGDGILRAKVLEITESGSRIVKFSYQGIFEEILDRIGVMPLPPYITEKLEEKERYQTVYAQHRGSVAAPTAGLHFTQQLLQEIERSGVSIARITLHVGLGTFRPVKAENVEDHTMHSESYFVPVEAAKKINEAKARGGRIIAIGTTSTRTLESVAGENGVVHPGGGKTDIFIYPGYCFKVVDGLVTNFHLPKSTLIMLVSALIGREETLKVYEKAVEERYRFFSFGDAMLII